MNLTDHGLFRTFARHRAAAREKMFLTGTDHRDLSIANDDHVGRSPFGVLNPRIGSAEDQPIICRLSHSFKIAAQLITWLGFHISLIQTSNSARRSSSISSACHSGLSPYRNFDPSAGQALQNLRRPSHLILSDPGGEPLGSVKGRRFPAGRPTARQAFPESHQGSAAFELESQACNHRQALESAVMFYPPTSMQAPV